MKRGIKADAFALIAVNSCSTSSAPLANASAPGWLLHYHTHTEALQENGQQLKPERYVAADKLKMYRTWYKHSAYQNPTMTRQFKGL